MDIQERNEEIRRLRFEELWILDDIGKKFGISRERVRQILGNTGDGIWLERNKRIINDPKFDGMLVGEIAEATGFSVATVYKHRNFSKTLEERFWEKVEKLDVWGNFCWVWLGAQIANGHGWMWADGERDYAHRVSWKLHCGEIPEGNWVRNKCGNKLCVNPKHLYLYIPKSN